MAPKSWPAVVTSLLVASCGGGGGASSSPAEMPQPASLELLAGATGGVGYFDGIGPTAKFFIPYGIAVDASGMIYVADSGNLVVRKVTPQGTVTTFAGSAGEDGFVDGIASPARFGRHTSFPGPLAPSTHASCNAYGSG